MKALKTDCYLLPVILRNELYLTELSLFCHLKIQIQLP
jgi:hypothetical protein